LRDFGISEKQLSQWERLATIPEEQFEVTLTADAADDKRAHYRSAGYHRSYGEDNVADQES
jgi:hypothetical protein